MHCCSRTSPAGGTSQFTGCSLFSLQNVPINIGREWIIYKVTCIATNRSCIVTIWGSIVCNKSFIATNRSCIVCSRSCIVTMWGSLVCNRSFIVILGAALLPTGASLSATVLTGAGGFGWFCCRTKAPLASFIILGGIPGGGGGAGISKAIGAACCGAAHLGCCVAVYAAIEQAVLDNCLPQRSANANNLLRLLLQCCLKTRPAPRRVNVVLAPALILN